MKAFQHRYRIIAILLAGVFCMTGFMSVKQEDAIKQAREEGRRQGMQEAAMTMYVEQYYMPVVATATEEALKVEDSFVVYEIPEEFVLTGGEFPVELQRYTAQVCEDLGVDYSLVLAMIEIESGYHSDAVSKCNAVGYMQIVEKWHVDRMAEYGFDQAKDPEANIVVGVDYMAELLSQYPEEAALMIYNSGNAGIENYRNGITSSAYARAIEKRKEEIQKELGI